MSVKSLEKEYAQVVSQYQEMMNDIKDMEKECQEGLVSPEFVDNLRKQIEPIKQNYQWWSYVMFTLHEPQRKAKREKYRQAMKKELAKLDKNESPEARLENGREALEGLKEIK